MDRIVGILAAQQAPATVREADVQLRALYREPTLSASLTSIAANASTDIAIRQSALLNLKQYVLASWSAELDEFEGQILPPDDVKNQVREAILQLSTADGVERQIQTIASNVLSKIAVADYPEQWPGLLQTILSLVQSSPSDQRLHGTLKVLAELADGLEEQQFFLIARDLVDALYSVAADGQRNPKIRALSASVFKSCFDTLQTLMEDHKAEIKSFAEQSLGVWMELLIAIINTELPSPPKTADEDPVMEHYRGWVALKTQVARVLIAIRLTFPSILAPRTPQLFSAVWSELSRLQQNYQETYIDHDIESRMEDADGLPYSLDFLILESLDFLQGCIRAPPVRKELEAQLQTQPAEANWIVELMKLTSSYSQITNEEEGMWDIDVNVFLAEETGVTANYTARTACGDLAIKIGEWLREKVLEGLLLYIRSIMGSSDGRAWRLQESALYMVDQILRDLADYQQPLSAGLCQALVEIAQGTIQSTHHFLRARGYSVLGSAVKVSGDALQSVASDLFAKSLNAIQADQSEAVQVSCIRSIQAYLAMIPPEQTLPLQAPIVQALQRWLSTKEMSELGESEELLFAVVESLRDVIVLDTKICLTGEGLNLLFSIASSGADSFQMTSVVTETFEEICSTIAPLGADAYAQLSSRVLPSLTGAFDVASMTEENALMSLSAELLAILSETAPSPLPAGFVAATLPKLSAILLNNLDDELLKTCTICLKHIMTHDPDQLLGFSSTAYNPPKTGLELVLAAVDRLLSPAIDDNSAAEVGGLAAALVDKAGPERLGNYLLPLLRAVASRVATAEKADLIQSLTLVFARLAAQNPKDVVDFLAQVQVEGQENVLQSVMAKWLENCGSFSGYENIRLNILALSRLFELHDERLAGTMVKGDIIIDSTKIMTRSRAKANPDRFTAVNVPMKIVKIFVDEFGTYSAAASAAAGAGIHDGAGSDAESDDEDEDWEDEDVLGGLTGTARAELMKFADETPGSAARQTDVETQHFLENFFRSNASDGQFQELLGQLNPGEQEKLRALG